MLLALILVSVALVVALGMLWFGGSRSGPDRLTVGHQLDAEQKARAKAEGELDKKRKELEEQRGQLAEAREQLKQAKRKLFDQKESGKGEQDLVKARQEVERNASIQLEVVRNELAQAQHDLERLKAELAGKGKRHPERPVERPATPAAPEAAKPAELEAKPEPKKYRDLSDADREKMERLEHEASRERGKALELDRELKKLKGRVETQNRIYLVTKGELDLVKDKFKALEKRLNRTLLESDLVKRALKDLATKTGVAAGRIELTAEEIAASDRKVDEAPAAPVQPEAREAPATPVEQ